MRRLRSLQAQILLWITLPLILVLVTVSLGSITLHQRSMRSMVAERDARLATLAAGRLDADLGALPTVFDEIHRGSEAQPYVVDQSGRIIYAADASQIGRDRMAHPGVRQALAGESGATFAHLPGEPEHVVGYAPLPAHGWALLVEEPWADVISPALQYTLWAPVLVLVAAVASIIALYFGLRRVVQPLQVLGRAASRLAWGDFQAIEKPVGGIDEVIQLQDTLQEMAAQIHRYQAGMQDYIAALTHTQEEERRRLARELHDETVQSLIAIAQRVRILELDWRSTDHAQANGDGDVEKRLAELSEMVTGALHEVRGVIRDLRPIYLEELGLVSALGMLAQNTNHNGTQLTFDVTGDERRLPGDTELALYRIAQAAVSNAIRHAHPKTVALNLDFGDEGVLLTAEDDGAGFVPPVRPSDLARDGHFGLIGMYERTTRLGGHLSIRSTPGQGTKVAAFLPHGVTSAAHLPESFKG